MYGYTIIISEWEPYPSCPLVEAEVYKSGNVIPYNEWSSDLRQLVIRLKREHRERWNSNMKLIQQEQLKQYKPSLLPDIWTLTGLYY